MAAPTVRGVGAFGSGTTSFTAAVPTGGSAPVSGDAMYIVMESTDSTTTAGTPATPAGWTSLFENTIAAGSSTEPAVSTLTVFGKIAGAGEANVSVTGVGNHCAGAMIVIADHGLSVITDTVVGTSTNHGTGTTNLLAPSITVTADSLIITAMGLGDDANDTTNISSVTNANLASITEQIDQTVNTGSGGGVGIYTATCAGTSTGTTSWDHDTAASSQSMQLGIKPSSDVTLAITGNAGTASVGSVLAALALAITGLVGTISVGNLAAYVQVALTGNGAISSVGSVLADIAVSITGNEATGAVGDVTPDEGGVTAALTGVEATSGIGNLSPDLSVELTGNIATGSVGLLAATAVTGVEATGSVGDLSPGISVGLTGNEAVGSVGSVSSDIALNGVEATGSVGSVGAYTSFTEGSFYRLIWIMKLQAKSFKGN